MIAAKIEKFPSSHLRADRSRLASIPPPATQKAGSTPLADCLNTDSCATVVLGAPDPFKPEVESTMDSNDTRMQQVTFIDGKLYGALDGRKPSGRAGTAAGPGTIR